MKIQTEPGDTVAERRCGTFLMKKNGKIYNLNLHYRFIKIGQEYDADFFGDISRNASFLKGAEWKEIYELRKERDEKISQQLNESVA